MTQYFFFFVLTLTLCYSTLVLYSTDVVLDSHYPVDIYFPDAEGTVPVIIFLGETGIHKSSYSEFASYLAEMGYIVIVPENVSISIIKIIQEYLADIEFPDVQCDSERIGLIGHGSGGVLSIIAAASNCHQLCAQQNLCQSETDCTGIPGLEVIIAYGSNLNDTTVNVTIEGISVNIFCGSLDGKMGQQAANDTFNCIGPAPRSWFLFNGLNHNSITNNPSMDPTETQQQVAISLGLQVLANNAGNICSAWLKDDDQTKQQIYVDLEVPDYQYWINIEGAQIPTTYY